MLPSHRSTVASSLPPVRRLVMFLILGVLVVTALNVVPGIFSRSAVREKLMMEEELRRVEDELKVTSQQLHALKQASSRPGSEFVQGKDQDQGEQTEEQRNAEIVTHKQLQTAKDEILQLEAELRRVKQSHAEAPKPEERLPEVFGTKVNSRLIKISYQKDAPEYQKTTYRALSVNSDANELIVLTSIAGADSYGKNRHFADFMETIKSIEFERTMSTLGLLVGSRDEYQNILAYMDANEDDTFFSKIIVIQSQFLEDLYSVARDDRHSLSLQKERRRAISRARNFLITNTLGDETYSLCIDADMVETPEDMLRVFVNSDKDVIVPRVRQGGAENYDFNSWQGKRIRPTAEEWEKMDTDPEFYFVPRPDGALHMHDFAFSEENDKKRDYAVQLDSVGGAVLFVKSEIFKQGIMFPPFYLIGSMWERLEGFDGIETEGLCYQARAIGYSCWGFPNVVAFHDLQDEN